jgi:deazaflavin-dependent oxidoreductase (nitroreductase family)
VTVADRRRSVRRLQRYLINPPMRAAVRLGLVPGHVLVETTGRRTGRRRRTVVGAGIDGRDVWVVAEQGPHAGWVANLLAQPRVRVFTGGRWRSGTARLVADDDPQARLDGFGRAGHARAVRRFGTDLRTVLIELDGP